ncbi:MAG TPA: 2-oxo acid dehydrogenase subunit E2 [Vulgatibacter sp.]|nr:2-oxo acid dehydrogenase subunit E2 [Vulgatibacter sp.]
MASAIQMPKLSDTMTEGTIQKWLVKEGQKVRAGDPVAEVETDKATLEMEAYESGTILKILTPDGGSAAVGAVIAVIGKPGEDWEKVAGAAEKQEPAKAVAPAPAPAAAAAPAPTGDAKPVFMPKLSDTMTEGTIQKWLVKEGQKVRAGDPIAEVETDKATLEMEAYDGGTVLKILVGDRGVAQVGSVIAVVGKEGADWQAVAAAGAPAAPEAAPAPAADAPAAEAKGEKVTWKPAAALARVAAGPATYQKRTAPGEIVGVTFGFGHGLAPAVPLAPRRANGEKVRASPLARKLAAEYGVDLLTVNGSGPGGRIVREDVEAARRAAPAAAQRPAAVAAAGETVPMSQMRKAIARNLQQSKREVPHFYLTIDVDMGAALALRKEAKASEVSVSVNDLVLKAVAVAAMKVPRVQGQLVEDGNAVFIPGSVNLGVAVALEDGLITPVVRGAESLSLGELGRQVRELAARARDRKLKPEEYQGGTITVSNLGMFDIEHFYAIVNPPQASIVSVGKVREEPVVVNGQIQIGQRMRLGYSGDHRVVDGAVGAQFLQALKKVLENPMQMLIG